ncbi:sigma-70 family RNA polymerase sigma factor [Denitromonas iodatirespirans]|uniref:Sigma-70 family RNA polymerase sigma factor n=1 Tax=Denitromonas iodatirespirans TaxID=2795389 RepID=A0A944H849_DENI1|nr:sigma-70 family RNA polymerase sigma factor [Denitromonas iodatirespirans]MBT0961000.1 sigma-70 family RNA polymerase sigma factor [Denitromonas iodatirespirans]
MLDDIDIRRLILLSAARDAAAFEQLYQRTAPVLLGVAFKITGRRELAEEVLHDAFIKIWHAATRFDPVATRPVAWMATIVRNRAIDTVSRADVARVSTLDDSEGALDRLFDWSASSEDEADQAQMRHWLRGCLDELKGRERQALVLAYLHGLSHGELADHLATPLGTVKSWVRRGLQSLKHCVDSCMGVS